MWKGALKDSIRVDYITFPLTYYYYNNDVSSFLYKIALFNFASSSCKILIVFLEVF